jgi:hypothetical protein
LRYARTEHNRDPGIAATGIFNFLSPYWIVFDQFIWKIRTLFLLSNSIFSLISCFWDWKVLAEFGTRFDFLIIKKKAVKKVTCDRSVVFSRHSGFLHQ